MYEGLTFHILSVGALSNVVTFGATGTATYIVTDKNFTAKALTLLSPSSGSLAKVGEQPLPLASPAH